MARFFPPGREGPDVRDLQGAGQEPLARSTRQVADQ
jgi:hypothetical protein